MAHARMNRMYGHVTIGSMMMGHRIYMTHMAHMCRGSIKIRIDIRWICLNW